MSESGPDVLIIDMKEDFIKNIGDVTLLFEEIEMTAEEYPDQLIIYHLC